MERVILSKEDAIAMLPDGDNVHTFRGGAFSLIGADWDKESIIELINEYEVELSGEMATNMDHGMVLKDNHGWLFIETKSVNHNEA